MALSFLFKFAFAIVTNSLGLVLAFLLTLNLPSLQDTINSAGPHRHFMSGRTVQNCCFPWNMSLETKGEYFGQNQSLFQLCSSVFVFLVYLNFCFTMKALSNFDNTGSTILSLLKDFDEYLSNVGRGYTTICLYFVRSLHFLACVDYVHSMQKRSNCNVCFDLYSLINITDSNQISSTNIYKRYIIISNAYVHIMWAQDYYISESLLSTCTEIKRNELSIVCSWVVFETHKTDVMLMDENFSW